MTFLSCSSHKNIWGWRRWVTYSKTPIKMSFWRDKIQKLLSVRAEHRNPIVRQIQVTARDSVVYDQITNQLHDREEIRIMSCLQHTLPRRHTLPEPNGVGPVGVNASDPDNPLLCATCEREILDDFRTWFSGHCPVFVWQNGISHAFSRVWMCHRESHNPFPVINFTNTLHCTCTCI